MKGLRWRFLTAEDGATLIDYAMLAASLSVPVLLVFAYLMDDALAILDFVALQLVEVLERIQLHL